MSKQSVKHPILKILHPTVHNNIIQEAYSSVKPFSLCWLANEQLEHQYVGNFINATLFFEAINNQIEFVDISNGKLIARIEFDRSLTEAPLPAYGDTDITEELQLVC